MHLIKVVGMCLPIALAGCDIIAPDPQFEFEDYTPQIPTGGIGYSLEASAISINPPDKDNTSSGTCDNASWWNCIVGATVTSAVIAPDSKTFPSSEFKTNMIVVPDNTFGNRITTSYTMTSTAIANDELLLKQVTISSQDNLDNIVKNAGTGAAAGFAFGPVGAAVGGLFGAASGMVTEDLRLNLAGPQAAVAPVPPFTPINNYVCKSDLDSATYDITQVNKQTNPKISLPLVIVPGPSDKFSGINQPTSSTDKNCWHILPNNSRTNVIGAPSANTPQAGDGWFYRFVDDSDFTDPETGIAATPVPNLTSKGGAAGFTFNEGVQFPVSACHKITLQITWWQSLEGHVAGGANPPAVVSVNYDEEIADPGYINYVTIPKSGSVNFRLVCGAYATNTFTGPPLGTLMTDITSQVTAVQKAQPTSSSSK